MANDCIIHTSKQSKLYYLYSIMMNECATIVEQEQ